jgi:hypothetical protein
MRTDQEIINQTNELARTVYRIHGYVVSSDFKFYLSKHPHELQAWHCACEAQKLLTETDPYDALDNLNIEFNM